MNKVQKIWETEITIMVRDLSMIILADGKNTNDERDLMISVNQNVNKFVNAYIKALDDDIITQEENDNLMNIWRRVYDKAKEVAKKDGVITSDERNVLLRIAKSVYEE